jgi:small subunit ribosomal protein S6
MNIECSTAVLEELTSAFRFNDAVIRNMVINRKEPVTEASLLAKRPEEKRERSTRDDAGPDSDAKASKSGDDDSGTRKAEADANA